MTSTMMTNPDVIKLREVPEATFGTQQRAYRDGIELEKGVVITQDWLERNESLLDECWSLYAAYPDIYLDMIKPQESNFDLFPY